MQNKHALSWSARPHQIRPPFVSLNPSFLFLLRLIHLWKSQRLMAEIMSLNSRRCRQNSKAQLLMGWWMLVSVIMNRACAFPSHPDLQFSLQWLQLLEINLIQPTSSHPLAPQYWLSIPDKSFYELPGNLNTKETETLFTYVLCHVLAPNFCH